MGLRRTVEKGQNKRMEKREVGQIGGGVGEGSRGKCGGEGSEGGRRAVVGGEERERAGLVAVRAAAGREQGAAGMCGAGVDGAGRKKEAAAGVEMGPGASARCRRRRVALRCGSSSLGQGECSWAWRSQVQVLSSRQA